MLEVSSRLGPYEIVAALGAGGMGEEQRYDDAIGRPVTLAFTFVWSGWAALALFFVLAVTVTGLRGRSRNQPQDGR